MDSSSPLKRVHGSWGPHLQENFKRVHSLGQNIHRPWKRLKTDRHRHGWILHGSSPVSRRLDEARKYDRKDGFDRSGNEGGAFSSTGAENRSDRGESGRRAAEGVKVQGYFINPRKPELRNVDCKQRTDQVRQERGLKKGEQDVRKGSCGLGFREDHLRRVRPSTAIRQDMDDCADSSLQKRRNSLLVESTLGHTKVSSEGDCLKRIIKLKTKHLLGVEISEAPRASTFSRIKIKEEKELSSSPSNSNSVSLDELSSKSRSTFRSCRVQQTEVMPRDVPLVFPPRTRRARSERRRIKSCKSKSSKDVFLEGFGTELEEALLKSQQAELDLEGQKIEKIQKGIPDVKVGNGSDALAQENSNIVQTVRSLSEADEREEGELEPEDEVEDKHYPEGTKNQEAHREGSDLNPGKSPGSEDLKCKKDCEELMESQRPQLEPARHEETICATGVGIKDVNKSQEYETSANCKVSTEALACSKVQSEQTRPTALVPCTVDDARGALESSADQNVPMNSCIRDMNEKQIINVQKSSGQSNMDSFVMEINPQFSNVRFPNLDAQQTAIRVQAPVDEFLERQKAPLQGQDKETFNVESFGDLENSFTTADEPSGDLHKLTQIRDHSNSQITKEQLDESSAYECKQIRDHSNSQIRKEQMDESSVYECKPKSLTVDFLQLSLALPGSQAGLSSSESIPRSSEDKPPQALRHPQNLSCLQVPPNGSAPSLAIPSLAPNDIYPPRHVVSPESQGLSCALNMKINEEKRDDSGVKGRSDASDSITRMECKTDVPDHEVLIGSKLAGCRGGSPRHGTNTFYTGRNQATIMYNDTALVQQNISVLDKMNMNLNESPLFVLQRPGLERTIAGDAKSHPVIKIGLLELATEPVAAMAQRLQELPDCFLEGLKGLVQDLLGNFAKREEFLGLQQILRNRSDLTEETLLRAHPVQLEVFVALKTGMQSFIRVGSKTLTYKALIEIFLQTRCRNVDCQQLLPVDDCECKICSEKKGFCHECMCVICSKFDSDSHTSRWVGCDVCMHWCHTDCGLRMSLIKPTPVSYSGSEFSEMQFQCLSCNHFMELYGFVKDVFENFVRNWGSETLAKELDCVRRIFHSSEDAKGKQLRWKAEEMLQSLERNASAKDVRDTMLQFFRDIGSQKTSPERVFPVPPSKNHPSEVEGPVEGIDKSFATNNSSVARKSNNQAEDKEAATKKRDGAEGSKKQDDSAGGSQELHSLLQAKLTDVLMYQAQADAAREDAFNLQHIICIKKKKLEEDYGLKSAKLKLDIVEEQQRKHLRELQALERSHYEYELMKFHIETDMKHLMMKLMERQPTFSVPHNGEI